MCTMEKSSNLKTDTFATMPQPKLARVATALMEEVVALKGLVGKESPVAKAYAELDAAHQAERDMLRRAVRPLNVWKFCLESTEYSALKSMGGKRSDCAAVMCGVASLLGDMGVCMPPAAMGRAGALMYKVPDPVLFIDLCGEEESTDDEDELPVVGSVTTMVQKASQDKEVEEASAVAAPVTLDTNDTVQTAQPDPLPSVTSADDHNRNRGTAWRHLGHAGGATVDEENFTAAQCFAKAIEINSKDFDAWFGLGSEGGGRVHGTSLSRCECYAQFLEELPNDYDDYAYPHKRVVAWGGVGFAGGARVSGTSYTASESLAKAIELGGDGNDRSEEKSSIIREASAVMWRQLGVVGGGRVNGKDYTPAECYAKALEFQPDVTNWLDLGASGGGLVSGQNYTRAQCFAKALEIKPDSESWFSLGATGGGNVLGRTYTEAECYGRALETTDGRDKTRNTTWIHLGIIGGGRVNDQDYTPAQCLAKALEIKPEAASWCHLGKVGGGLVSEQKYTPAQCFGKALEIDPLSWGAWDCLGDAGGGDVLGRTYSAAECQVKVNQTIAMSFLPKKS